MNEGTGAAKMKREIRIEVSRLLPKEETDPRLPGKIHWVFDEIERVLYCSREAFHRLARMPDAQKDELLFAMGATAQ